MRAVPAPGALISISGLTKDYGRRPVLRGVDLELGPAQTTAIIGPNGAGKTTLIKAILGLIRPTEGHVSVLGTDVASDHTYRAHIGYVPQLAAFPDNLTGGQVIDLISRVRGRRGNDAELCREFGLGDEMHKSVRNLSGGTRQKLSAVLAFMFEPPILVLDEPTAGLDPLASSTLKDLIRDRSRNGAAVILTSHVMADLEELCDRVIFLMDGKVRFDGTLETLRLEAGEHQLERAIASLLRSTRVA